MNHFYGRSWRISLLRGWIGEDEEACSLIYHPEGVGALQISSYTKDGTVTEVDLKDLAQDHLDAGARLAPAKAGDFKGFTLKFGSNGKTWQVWYVANGPNALMITYNCQEEDNEIEIGSVKDMISTLSAT